MDNFAKWAAIRTVKAKIGTWKGYEKYNAQVGGITREEWAQQIGEVKAALANRVEESARALNRRPVVDEITTYLSKKARGYLQQVEIYVRDRETGVVEARPFVVKTQTLRSRQSIIAEARQKYQASIDQNPDEYPEEILGASYTGTHHMIPRK